MAEKKRIAPATPAEDKKKALETALQQIEKNFGKGTVMRLDLSRKALSIE